MSTLAPKRTIFDIDSELDQIADAVDRLEDGGTDEQVVEAVETYFGDLMVERDRKLDGYAAYIAERTELARARKVEADRLAALARADENAAKRLKGLLTALFAMKGWTKQETPATSSGSRRTAARRPSRSTPPWPPNRSSRGSSASRSRSTPTPSAPPSRPARPCPSPA